MGKFHNISIIFQTTGENDRATFPQTHIEKALQQFVQDHLDNRPRPGPKQIVGVWIDGVRARHPEPIMEQVFSEALRQHPISPAETLAVLATETAENKFHMLCPWCATDIGEKILNRVSLSQINLHFELVGEFRFTCPHCGVEVGELLKKKLDAGAQFAKCFAPSFPPATIRKLYTTLQTSVDSALMDLKAERLRLILTSRFASRFGGRDATLGEVAHLLDRTGERIRILEGKALQLIGHSDAGRRIREIVDVTGQARLDELQAQIEALQKENAELRGELGKKPRPLQRMTISDLGLRTETQRLVVTFLALLNEPPEVDVLCQHSEQELLTFQDFGLKRLKELVDALAKFGFKLYGPEVPKEEGPTLEDLKPSARLRNALKRHFNWPVGEDLPLRIVIEDLSERNLLQKRVRGLGPNILAELKAKLAEHGLALREK